MIQYIKLDLIFSFPIFQCIYIYIFKRMKVTLNPQL